MLQFYAIAYFPLLGRSFILARELSAARCSANEKDKPTDAPQQSPPSENPGQISLRK
jgi:hypothetical protein